MSKGLMSKDSNSAQEERIQSVAELSKQVGEAVEKMTDMWVNNGWQLRKRAGRWFPELVQHGDIISESGLRTTKKSFASEDRKAETWLSSDAGSRAVTSPGLGEVERELAVASEFRQFLARPEMKDQWRRDGELIIFKNEEALSRSVAVFALDLTKELGAAARALARYVDDLEIELAAADEQTVRLRADLLDAERIVEEKSIVAEESVNAAAEVKLQVVQLASDLADQERAARVYEKKAREASRRIVEVEAKAENSSLALKEAFENAVHIESQLADAEKKALQYSRDLHDAERRAQTSSRLAENLKRDRDAADEVVRALEKRALAAELSANESAAELEAALLNSMQSDSRLAATLDAVTSFDDLGDDELSSIVERDQFLFGDDDDDDDDNVLLDFESEIPNFDTDEKPALAALDSESRRKAAADLSEARTTVRRAVQGTTDLPSIWKMRKAELAEEFMSYGRDPTGLKVNELRAAVRVERTKSSSASAKNSETKNPESR